MKFYPPIKTRDREAIDYFRNTVGKKCLVFYINDGHRRINQLRVRINNFENELSTALPNEVFQCLKQTAIEKLNVKREHEKERLSTKYEKISRNDQPVVNTHCVKKLSSKQLIENQFRVLARGQNYALPHSNKDVYEFVAVTDNIVDSLENTSRESKSEIKSQIQTAIKSEKREREREREREKFATWRTIRS